MAAPTTSMRIQSIRFSETMWQEIQAEATLEGVSASQFVREAAFARMWFARGRRGEQADKLEAFLMAARVEMHEDGSGDNGTGG